MARPETIADRRARPNAQRGRARSAERYGLAKPTLLLDATPTCGCSLDANAARGAAPNATPTRGVAANAIAANGAAGNHRGSARKAKRPARPGTQRRTLRIGAGESQS